MAKAKPRVKVSKKTTKVADTTPVETMIDTLNHVADKWRSQTIRVGARVKVRDGSYYSPEETLEGMVGTVTHIDSFLYNKKSFVKVVLDDYDFGDDYSYFAVSEILLLTEAELLEELV